ncbi:UDP-glucose 4-epimerase, partial [Candidatus Bathyarchaeota archaeon]
MLITGGAGFIGSHLCEALYRLEAQITILDNLSSGSIENLKHVLNAHKSIRFYKGDCVNPHDIEKSLKNIEVVFHFAANPEVRLERNDPKTCFQQNVYATHVLLEGIKNKAQVHTIVFASTSTVYGDATLIPTPENYAPLKPLSVYGASKLASEALIIAYAHTYNKKAIILRFANIIGSRSQHGVIHDFIQKLRNNPKQLMILGDGNQNKSYLYINDCINAVLTVLETSQN